MDLTGTSAATRAREQITFWYGCNMLRHGDIIRGCADVMRALGFEVFPVGGPAYCCGTVKDSNQTAAEGMGKRTMSRFNKTKDRRVITWCPSCHMHMNDFMEKAYPREFGLTYFVDLLYDNRQALAKLLTQPVPMRVFLHKHVGFAQLCDVNQKVSALLRLIPGIVVVEHDEVAPGYMCTHLLPIPGAMSKLFAATLAGVKATGADVVVAIYHSCYREACGLEVAGHVPVFNYMHLILRSMGIDHVDEYKAWRKAGPDAAELIEQARLDAVGSDFFERSILPELVGKPSSALNRTN